MRMIFSLMLFSAITSFATSSYAQEGQPLTLQSRMDSQLKSIIETMAVSVVKGFPMLGRDSKLIVSESSPLEQGIILGNFEVQSNDPQSPSTSSGQIAINLTNGKSGKVALGIVTTGQLATEQIVKFLSDANLAICIGVSSDSCAVNPLLNAEDSALPVGQQATIAFTRFKENLLAYLSVFASQAEAPRKRQTFGEPSDDEASSAPGMSAEAAVQLHRIIESSLIIQPQDSGALVSINMDQVQNTAAAELNATVSMLMSFKDIQINIVDSSTSYSLSTSNEIPANVIATYDAYIYQEQNKPEGLNSLNDLVQNMGLWLVETCSTSQMQPQCFDQLMSVCARSVGHVATCIGKVTKLKASRDANRAGDTWGAAGNAAQVVIDDQLQKAGDAASDFFSFGWLFGPQQP